MKKISGSVSLPEKTYLRGLVPKQDYAFFVQSATEEERKQDTIIVPREHLSQCAVKECRAGATFWYRMRWAENFTKHKYVLLVDGDGFLCYNTMMQLVAQVPEAQDVAIGTWHTAPQRPDQHFVLLSRDVAVNLSQATSTWGRRGTTATERWSSVFEALPNKRDAQMLALHPKHNAKALLYQGWFNGPTVNSFCDSHVWIHFCCTFGKKTQIWNDLQRGASKGAANLTAVEKLFSRRFKKRPPPRHKATSGSVVLKLRKCGHCKGPNPSADVKNLWTLRAR